MAENQKKLENKPHLKLTHMTHMLQYDTYTPCIHLVYHASEWYILQVLTSQLHGIKY